MKNFFYFLLFCIAVLQLPAQNITVSSAVGQTPDSFLYNTLVGEGVYIYNVKFNNSTASITKAQIGSFDANGFITMGMDSGIVMTTGNISVAPGPNNSTSMSSPITGYYTDTQMNTYATGTLHACSTLDFDFVGLSPHMSFNYSFGSEEYPEYVASSYNDVFAFLLTGEDPETGDTVTKNIAMIPGTVSTTNPNGIAVSINSVNPGTPGSSGSASTAGYYSQYSSYYVSNAVGDTGVQYDGRTTKLAATADIVPCAVYHMHISICNVGDNSFDSGVFLEARSLNSPGDDMGLSLNDTVEVGCPLHVSLVPTTSNYTYGDMKISFGGAAVNGTDYLFTLSDGTTLQDSATVSLIDDYIGYVDILPLANDSLYAPKDLEIYFATNFCSNYPDLIKYDTMHLVLVPARDYALFDTTITAQDTCHHVAVNAYGGYSPLQFQWAPKSHLDNPYAQSTDCCITESTDYYVVTHDRYGCNEKTATVHIIVNHGDSVGMESVTAEPKIDIYPNPAHNETNILISGVDGTVNAVLTDLNGRQILSESFSCSYDCSKNLSVNDVKPGTYLLKITTKDSTTTKKIVLE